MSRSAGAEGMVVPADKQDWKKHPDHLARGKGGSSRAVPLRRWPAASQLFENGEKAGMINRASFIRRMASGSRLRYGQSRSHGPGRHRRYGPAVRQRR